MASSIKRVPRLEQQTNNVIWTKKSLLELRYQTVQLITPRYMCKTLTVLYFSLQPWYIRSTGVSTITQHGLKQLQQVRNFQWCLQNRKYAKIEPKGQEVTRTYHAKTCQMN